MRNTAPTKSLRETKWRNEILDDCDLVIVVRVFLVNSWSPHEILDKSDTISICNIHCSPKGFHARGSVLVMFVEFFRLAEWFLSKDALMQKRKTHNLARPFCSGSWKCIYEYLGHNMRRKKKEFPFFPPFINLCIWPHSLIRAVRLVLVTYVLQLWRAVFFCCIHRECNPGHAYVHQKCTLELDMCERNSDYGNPMFFIASTDS